MDEDFKAVSEDVASGPPSGETTGEQAFDPDRYRHHLEDFALTREQEDELMRVLWTMMLSFVDLGWGVDSVHNIFAQMVDKSLQGAENPIDSNNRTIRKTLESAAQTAGKDET